MEQIVYNFELCNVFTFRNVTKLVTLTQQEATTRFEDSIQNLFQTELLTPIQNIIEVSKSSRELSTVEKLKQNNDMVFNTAQLILYQVNLSLYYFGIGNYNSQMVSCDIRNLANNVLKVLKPQAKLRGITFHNVDMVAERTIVSIDQSRIDQILYYMVVNAIHRNRLGGNIVIKKDEHRIGNNITTLQIQIIDDGPGIDLRDQELIYKPINSLTHN